SRYQPRSNYAIDAEYSRASILPLRHLMSAFGPQQTSVFAPRMLLRLSVNGERSSYASPPLSSLIIVVAMMAMMMTPIVTTGVIRVGGVTTVIIRSPPAPAIATADPTYLLHVRRAVCRDWRDRHCSRCGRC